MHTEFRRAELPRELRTLVEFDRKVFSATDAFDAATWKTVDAYWLLLNGKKAGCCAFAHHSDIFNTPEPGTLYIVSTGVLPQFRGRGLGTLLKSWEIAFARHHGYHRVLTNMRASNQVMIALNRKHHFRTLRTIPDYYVDPAEATVVMQLVL